MPKNLKSLRTKITSEKLVRSLKILITEETQKMVEKMYTTLINPDDFSDLPSFTLALDSLLQDYNAKPMSFEDEEGDEPANAEPKDEDHVEDHTIEQPAQEEQKEEPKEEQKEEASSGNKILAKLTELGFVPEDYAGITVYQKKLVNHDLFCVTIAGDEVVLDCFDIYANPKGAQVVLSSEDLSTLEQEVVACQQMVEASYIKLKEI